MFGAHVTLGFALIAALGSRLAYSEDINLETKEHPKLLRVFSRDFQPLGKPKITLSLFESETYVLHGRQSGSGHFVELHKSSLKDRNINEQTVYRTFAVDAPLTSPNKPCWDATIDEKTAEIYLCCARGDAFGVWVISRDAVPRIAMPASREISQQESDNVLEPALTTVKTAERFLTASPDHLKFLGLSFEQVRINKNDSKLRVALTTGDKAKPQPPVVLYYSLTEKRWLSSAPQRDESVPNRRKKGEEEEKR